MGRIKTIAIKTLGNELIREHGDKFTDDFEKNKKILSGIKEMKSKKMRNVLIGYITKEMKKISKSGL
ncbi:MAG: 30S ribosomal protein S17e [Candidatus Aenigmarchaeota archaeon]